jgi:CHAT domain-containing protein
LVIVPDGALHGVPFAAMKDARSGRLLVEDAVISVAPSATLFLASVERVLQPLMASGVLVAGNASSAAHRIAGLGPLPRVSDEVDRVAGLYPSARVLLGEAVTEPDFLRLARSSNVVHFAGHALVNDSRPGFAALLLAPSPNGQGDGVLYAYELLQQRLGATRLVVLSACNTQSSVAKQALGLGGIVRPLIGAGVSGVVANMWPIEDFAAEQVMTRFHRHYVHGAGAAEALAAAQRELLHGPDRLMRDPAHWSGFEVFGFAPSPYQRGERRTAWDS